MPSATGRAFLNTAWRAQPSWLAPEVRPLGVGNLKPYSSTNREVLCSSPSQTMVARSLRDGFQAMEQERLPCTRHIDLISVYCVPTVLVSPCSLTEVHDVLVRLPTLVVGLMFPALSFAREVKLLSRWRSGDLAVCSVACDLGMLCSKRGRCSANCTVML